jgi:hypothetical protein
VRSFKRDQANNGSSSFTGKSSVGMPHTPEILTLRRY